MNTLLRWVLAALAGLAARWLAVKVGGTCPLAPETFVCGHWETIAGIAAAILTALGYPVKRTRPALAASKAPQKAEPLEANVPDLSPAPASWGENVEQNTDLDSPIGGG